MTFPAYNACCVVQRQSGQISSRMCGQFLLPPILLLISSGQEAPSREASAWRHLLDYTRWDDFVYRDLGLILVAYGLTETTTGTHFLHFGDAENKLGSVGRLCANVEARLVTDDEGTIDAEDETPGELWVRAKTVMKVRYRPSLCAELLIIFNRAGIFEQPTSYREFDYSGWMVQDGGHSHQRPGFILLRGG